MAAFQVVNQALSIAKSRLAATPDFDILKSLVAQLQYLSAVLNGKEADRSRLKTIIVGHYAVKEFEESDPELADALVAAQAVATKMAKGLKVD
jgi:Tsi6